MGDDRRRIEKRAMGRCWCHRHKRSGCLRAKAPPGTRTPDLNLPRSVPLPVYVAPRLAATTHVARGPRLCQSGLPSMVILKRVVFVEGRWCLCARRGVGWYACACKSMSLCLVALGVCRALNARVNPKAP